MDNEQLPIVECMKESFVSNRINVIQRSAQSFDLNPAK